MKSIKKIQAIIISICLLLPMFSIVSQAASGSVSISGKSANVGSSVTISCTVKCSSGPIGYADVTLTYDPSALQWVSGTNMAQGGSGSVHYVGTTPDGTTSSLSFSMTFKILKAGSHKVTTSSVSASDIDEIPFTPSKSSGTITGKAPSSNTNNNNNNTNNNTNNNNTQQNNKDKNNKLSSLQVYPGTLTPAFNAGTTSYTVTVPADTKEVTISATAQSNKATVSVSGGKDLKLGPNEAQVIVVAENGSSIAYNLTIMCGEVEKIQINGADNTIYEGFADEEVPTGFTRTKLMYNEREYEGLINQSETMRLMGLRSEAGTAFYIYNQENQEFYPFVQIQIAEGKYIVPLPLNAEVETFKDSEKVSLTLQGQTIETWKLDEEFSVAYVMNQDGEECLYRYDSVDGTFQRYVDIEAEEPEPVNTDRTWFPTKYYGYALIGLVALVAILWITMVYFIASRKHRHEARKVKAMKKAEKQKRKEEKRAKDI